MMIKKNEITNDSEWMVELEPICTEPGWRVKADNDSTIIGPPSREYINFILFNNLKSDEGEPIPPTGHTWGKTTLVKEPDACHWGYKTCTCQKCGAVMDTGIPATESHQFGDWKVIEEPTDTTNGTVIRTCLVCDLVDKRIIPARNAKRKVKDKDVMDEENWLRVYELDENDTDA